MNDIKDLLERAAAGAGRCTVTSEDVHTEAARIRSRRMAVASGALVAVLASAAFVGAALDSWHDEQRASATAGHGPVSGVLVTSGTEALLEGFIAMMPQRLREGGSFHQAESAHDRRHEAPTDRVGPFDGRILTPSGYLYIEYFDEDDVMRSDRVREMLTPGQCEADFKADCRTEKVPGSGQLEIWSQKQQRIMLWQGFHGGYSGILRLPDGAVLTITEAVRDKTKLQSLTRVEFRELMLRAEFLPEEK
ncbi:hypothetical protein [Streptomyces sp. NBC_00690]|uniref:hypothetical protein n=1 Tax=Streptomyces sp. NBC_00690 TaxID=2975808 RepID=UPI002E2E28F9|nr:hypothetical protein [Streptomyces sp. NBC_00690]